MNTWLEVGSGGNGELAGNWPYVPRIESVMYILLTSS